MLGALENQEMNGQVKVTRRTLRTITYSPMVHAQVLEAYINFGLIYTADIIFLVLPIKDLINEDGKTTTPFKVPTGKTSPVSHLQGFFVRVLYKKLLHMLGSRR